MRKRITRLNRKYGLWLALLLIPACCICQKVAYRQYKPGESWQFRLTTEVYRNNNYSGKSVSVSEHTVIRDSGIPGEEIRWLSKIHYNTKDTVSADSIAQQVKPYRISLSPKGKVPLPSLTDAEMVGDITDLNTFLVAISPALKAQELSQSKKQLSIKEHRQGDFADGIRILYGKDCLEISQELVKTTKEFSIIRTDFTPPATLCLDPLADTVGKKIFDHPNNFQMIQKGAGDKVNFFWGVETFTITTKLDNKTGQIIDATMSNTLRLRMRYNSTADFKAYDAEMPFTIQRNLKLELISN